MWTKIRVVLFILFGIILLAVSTFVIIRKDHISPLPEDTVGNSAGNLRGQGLFCEHEGKIYFSNAYDNGSLYSMNPDCTEIKKISTSSASFINAGGNYLFYYMESSRGGTGLGYVRSTHGVYRIRKNGNHAFCLNPDMTTQMQLAGNHLYYQHYDNQNFSTLNKLSVNKTPETVLTEDIIDPSALYNGVIYYAGNTDDHNLYILNTENDSRVLLKEGEFYDVTPVGDYIYYMDISKDYALCRYSMSQDTTEVIVNERLDFYNIYDNVIFCQVSSTTAPMLIRVNLDGGDREVVAEGVYNRINTTSVYTYFYKYEEDVPVYRTPTMGSVNVTTFDEAMQAAIENQ